MGENVLGFFGGKECIGAPQHPLGFAMTVNMWDLVGCLVPDNLHSHPQPPHVIAFGFVTTSILDCQAHTIFKHILGFFFI